MSNLIEEFKKGQRGENKGIPFGRGLERITKATNGIQKARMYGVASPPKVGKSTFVNYAFVSSAYHYYLKHKIDIEWIYLSLEIDRVSMEFDFAVYFIHHYYDITYIELEKGITVDGEKYIEISADYLRGRLQDDNYEVIKIHPTILQYLKDIYKNHIIPLFGEHDAKGRLIKKGLMTFITIKDNPTGYYYYLLEHAEKNGALIKEKYGDSERIVGYEADNPAKYTLVITDHLRKLIPERGFNEKQTVDKYIEYSVDIRNWCEYTFIHIIHTNRNLADSKRLQFFGDDIYPTAEDIKGTGNLSEECDYLFTLFNPNDDRYNLKRHFDLNLKDKSHNSIYPELRTIHLVESRHCFYPQHFKVNMKGSYKSFEPLNL